MSKNKGTCYAVTIIFGKELRLFPVNSDIFMPIIDAANLINCRADNMQTYLFGVLAKEEGFALSEEYGNIYLEGQDAPEPVVSLAVALRFWMSQVELGNVDANRLFLLFAVESFLACFERSK